MWYKLAKQYLFIGMPLNKDSKRMMMSDIINGAAERKVGCNLLDNSTSDFTD